jgi:hypothetical protein
LVPINISSYPRTLYSSYSNLTTLSIFRKFNILWAFNNWKMGVGSV